MAKGKHKIEKNEDGTVWRGLVTSDLGFNVPAGDGEKRYEAFVPFQYDELSESSVKALREGGVTFTKFFEKANGDS